MNESEVLAEIIAWRMCEATVPLELWERISEDKREQYRNRLKETIKEDLVGNGVSLDAAATCAPTITEKVYYDKEHKVMVRHFMADQRFCKKCLNPLPSAPKAILSHRCLSLVEFEQVRLRQTGAETGRPSVFGDVEVKHGSI